MDAVQTTSIAQSKRESELASTPAAHSDETGSSAWVWENPHNKALAALCYTATLRRIPLVIGRYFDALESCFRRRE
jgi:hypothetical protein